MKHQSEPRITEEQAENALERIYKAVHLPFDRDAYRSLSKKALRGRALRIFLSLALIAIVTVAVLGGLGFFTHEYLRNVVIQPQSSATTVSPPGAADAWMEGSDLVLQLQAGDEAIDYARTAVTLAETGAAIPVTTDEAQGQLRMACPPEGGTFEITLCDAAGGDYLIRVTVSAEQP